MIGTVARVSGWAAGYLLVRLLERLVHADAAQRAAELARHELLTAAA